MAKIVHEKRGIKRHFKDGTNEREPGFLKSPEFSEAAIDPNVEAAVFGNRASEFADHQSSGKTPKERRDEQNQQSARVTSGADDVLKAVRAAGDHEESGGNEGKESEFGG